ncbi:MAG: HNH endonuclease [Thermodesulfobacteriota bacterium]|nr:HNH endonuclease [Thermodesulfobacteriota bacterium]
MAKRHRQQTPVDSAAWGGVIDEDYLKREKNKAREIRQTQWWKQRIARGICYYCGKKIPPRKLTMDHVVPLSRGGKSTKGNVVPACKACNTQKSRLVPVEWEEYLEKIQAPETKTEDAQ